MGRRLVLLMAVLVVTSSMAMAQEWIQNPAGYMEISIQRVEEGSRLLIQMRPIFEALDWVVDWAAGSQTITATHQSGQYRMTMQIDNHLVLVNGEQFNLDVPPRLIYGSTFVPLRFVAEVTDCQVDYMVSDVKITGQDGTVLVVHLIED
ncbi:copper amine oxidase N-terminal domain-containing protein [bacterium]|nr:copper amine oxidase N-terminal domain-containing protein [bacterium]